MIRMMMICAVSLAGLSFTGATAAEPTTKPAAPACKCKDCGKCCGDKCAECCKDGKCCDKCKA